VGFFLFLSVATASVFTIVAVSLWATERRKEREAYYHSEVLKKIVESPGSGAAAVEYLRERQRIADRNVRGGLRLAGLIVFFAGIGLMTFLAAVQGPPPQLGVIPVLVGLALLLYGQFLAPRESETRSG
jgi:Flp pilus assembly protein TadB